MWTKRQLHMLTLISQHIEGISGAQLASTLSISDRLVRYEIQSINLTLKAFDSMVYAKQPNGYFIEGKDYDIIQTILHDQHVSKEPDYEMMILGWILFHPSCHIDELVELTHYSESTVMKMVNQLLKSFSIPIFVIENQHIYVTSNEQNIRTVVDQLIKRRIFKQLQQNDYALFVDVHKQALFNDLEQKIMDYIHSEKLDYSHLTFHYLLWITYFFTIRNQTGFILDELSHTSDYKTLDSMIHWINEEHVVLTPFDSELLNSLFKDIKTVSQSLHRLTELIYQLFKNQVLQQFKIDIDQSPELSSQLFHHINGLHQRLQLQLQAETLYATSIKKRYPYAYFIASTINPCFLQLTSKLVSFEEIAMIALYIEQFLSKHQQLNVLVVNHQTDAITQNIVRFIDTHFNQRIIILKVIPIYQAIHMDYYDEVDFIISHTPFKSSYPMCIINTLPTDEDRKRIFNVINQVNHCTNYINMMDTLFKSENCLLLNPTSLNELLTSPVYGLNFSKIQMNDDKILASLFSDWMLVVEQNGDKDGVSMILLEQPLHFLNISIEIVFVITTSSSYNENLPLLFEFLKALSKQKHIIKRLKNTTDSSGYLHELYYYAKSINNQ